MLNILHVINNYNISHQFLQSNTNSHLNHSNSNDFPSTFCLCMVFSVINISLQSFEWWGVCVRVCTKQKQALQNTFNIGVLARIAAGWLPRCQTKPKARGFGS